MIHRALCVLLALLLACSSPAHGRELKQAQPGVSAARIACQSRPAMLGAAVEVATTS